MICVFAGSVSCFGFVNLVFLECCPYVIAMVAI
jgi:hypothetical protein